jgi:hypothetical protein
MTDTKKYWKKNYQFLSKISVMAYLINFANLLNTPEDYISSSNPITTLWKTFSNKPFSPQVLNNCRTTFIAGKKLNLSKLIPNFNKLWIWKKVQIHQIISIKRTAYFQKKSISSILSILSLNLIQNQPFKSSKKMIQLSLIRLNSVGKSLKKMKCLEDLAMQETPWIKAKTIHLKPNNRK